jgi:hypothetical protein
VKRTSAAAVTSLPRAPRDEAQGRVRQYVITMSIRVLCFLLMFFVQPFGWWTWVFGIAAAVLPYIAVVVANAGDDSTPTSVESPRIELDAAPVAQPDGPPAPQVITLAESTAAREQSPSGNARSGRPAPTHPESRP